LLHQILHSLHRVGSRRGGHVIRQIEEKIDIDMKGGGGRKMKGIRENEIKDNGDIERWDEGQKGE
jgi:hypothetical protein